MTKNQYSTTTNIWNYKPWWCQPWSIILTGTLIIATSWLLLHRFWFSILVSCPIALWWIYFLIIYPSIALETKE